MVTHTNYTLLVRQCQTKLASNKPLYDRLKTARYNTNKHAILRATAATRRSGHCPGLLSGKGRWIRERRARRCRTAVDATRRRPTSRLADPHSGKWPLRRPTRPNTDGSVRGLDTARRILFSSRLTNDPARSTTSANSSPPDRLASALLADPRPDTVDNVGGLVSAQRTRFSSPG